MPPKTLILRTAGTNCDRETAHAFELAGASAEFLHINRLLERPALLDDYQLLAIPGGFSYGDDIAAGRIFANQIRHHLADAFARFIDAGKPIIGICNGFQVLVKTDLLPGAIAGQSGQTCTLANNDCGRFVDRWVCLSAPEVPSDSKSGSAGATGGLSASAAPLSPRESRLERIASKCIWTQGIDRLVLPIAHGEGKFIPRDESIRRALWDNGQVALVYAAEDGSPAAGRFPDNPNGSTDDIAGICDATGLVFGLMPHPERHVDPTQHPAWTRAEGEKGVRSEKGVRNLFPAEGHGLAIFRNAVRHATAALGAGV